MDLGQGLGFGVSFYFGQNDRADKATEVKVMLANRGQLVVHA